MPPSWLAEPTDLALEDLLGRSGPEIARAMSAAQEYLHGHPNADLLRAVGDTVASVPQVEHLGRDFLAGSLRGGAVPDLLAGRGLFFITEDGKLFLDCTSGHYQMTWGYNHPDLNAAVVSALQQGVVWDDHTNIPGNPVKRLAAKLVELANPGGSSPEELLADPAALNTVLLHVCTGSVACGAALKITLRHFQRVKPQAGQPAIIVLDGNYHGTDMCAQRLRGMWPELFCGLEVVSVQPNDEEELRRAFAERGERVAGFWAEPVMMNREAIWVRSEYLQAARALCDETGALMTVDEIQTGFWVPEVLMFHQAGIRPDMVVVGKGMTAGFHPLSAVVLRRELDVLETYDAISTNGHTPLPAYVALCSIALIESRREHIARMGALLEQRLRELAQEFPSLIASAQGKGLLSGLKFRRAEDALAFHARSVERGLWTRAHAYHAGHSTVLTKFALIVDEPVVSFTATGFRELLARLA